MYQEDFKNFGPQNNSGTHLVSLSGHVNRPGVYELRMDVNMKDIIYEFGGGIRNGKKLKGQKLLVPMKDKAINVTVSDFIFFDSKNERLNA